MPTSTTSTSSNAATSVSNLADTSSSSSRHSSSFSTSANASPRQMQYSKHKMPPSHPTYDNTFGSTVIFGSPTHYPEDFGNNYVYQDPSYPFPDFGPPPSNYPRQTHFMNANGIYYNPMSYEPTINRNYYMNTSALPATKSPSNYYTYSSPMGTKISSPLYPKAMYGSSRTTQTGLSAEVETNEIVKNTNDNV